MTDRVGFICKKCGKQGYGLLSSHKCKGGSK